MWMFILGYFTVITTIPLSLPSHHLMKVRAREREFLSSSGSFLRPYTVSLCILHCIIHIRCSFCYNVLSWRVLQFISIRGMKENEKTRESPCNIKYRKCFVVILKVLRREQSLPYFRPPAPLPSQIKTHIKRWEESEDCVRNEQIARADA